MFTHLVPTSTSAVAGLLGHSRDSLPRRTRRAAQVVAICALHHQLLSRCRSHRLLLRVQCVCGHEREAGRRLLFRCADERPSVHCYVIGAADPDELDPESQVSGTVLDDCECVDGRRRWHHDVLPVDGHSVDQRPTSDCGSAALANVLRHGYLCAGGNRCRHVAGEQHEDAAEFYWVPRCAEHWHGLCGGTVLGGWVLGIPEVRRGHAGQYYAEFAGGGQVSVTKLNAVLSIVFNI